MSAKKMSKLPRATKLINSGRIKLELCFNWLMEMEQNNNQFGLKMNDSDSKKLVSKEKNESRRKTKKKGNYSNS